MNRRTLNLAVALALLLPVLGLATAALAQTSPNYNLEWHVIGGGGQPVSSANYAVNSTIGQAVAGPPMPASASYAVSGGYWYAAVVLPYYHVYLPVVVRGY